MRPLAPPPVAPTRRMPPFFGAAKLGRGSRAAAAAAAPPANALPRIWRLVTRWPVPPAELFLVLIPDLPREPARWGTSPSASDTPPEAGPVPAQGRRNTFHWRHVGATWSRVPDRRRR